jgi:hypothetical protein
MSRSRCLVALAACFTFGGSTATLTVSGNLTVGATGTPAVNAGTFNLTGGSLTLDGMMTTGASASANWAGGR